MQNPTAGDTDTDTTISVDSTFQLEKWCTILVCVFLLASVSELFDYFWCFLLLHTFFFYNILIFTRHNLMKSFKKGGSKKHNCSFFFFFFFSFSFSLLFDPYLNIEYKLSCNLQCYCLTIKISVQCHCPAATDRSTLAICFRKGFENYWMSNDNTDIIREPKDALNWNSPCLVKV